MIIDSVRNFLEQNGIKNCSITVALSGGKDSVALLLALIDLKEEFELCLTAAHLNHNLRNEESDRDEKFVRELCRRLNVQLKTESLPIADLALSEHKGLEETARRYRYDFLMRESDGYIAVAHNREDNAETVLLNIIRGTGVQGLCGIAPINGRIIRPLLKVPTFEIFRFLSERGESFVTDSTNFNTAYSRNRVRGEIIPQAEKINADVTGALLRLSDIASEYEKHISGEAKELLKKADIKEGYDASVIKGADQCLRRKAVSMIIAKKIKQNVSYLHIETAEKLLFTEGSLNLPENLFFTVKDGIIRLDHMKKSENYQFCYPFDCKTAEYGDFSVKCDIIARDDFILLKKVNNLAKFIFLDCDKIPNRLKIRSRKEGDVFCPYGRKRKTLKKHFIDAKIPQQKRSHIAVLASCDDDIIAVEGFGASEDYGVSDKTERILKVEIRRAEDDLC